MRIPDWLNAKLAALRGDAMRIVRWGKRAGPFYAGSAAAHVLAVIVVLAWTIRDTPEIEQNLADDVDTEIKEPEVARFIIGTPPVRLSELTTRSLAMVDPPAQTEKKFDDSPLFEDAGGGTKQESEEPAFGGLGGFIASVGAENNVAGKLRPEQGIGVGRGGGDRVGSGGWAEGFNGAGRGSRTALQGSGEEQETERAVAAALNWLRRHQQEDGSWSLTGYAHQCREQTCLGACDTQDDVLATSLAMLPFLAAGQTHNSAGPYQTSLQRALDWLLAHQSPEGGLTVSDSGRETQAIATLCLCEVYSLTGDARVAEAAQQAMQFLENNSLSAMEGWQWAAVSSADRAGLSISAALKSEAHTWMSLRTAELSATTGQDLRQSLRTDPEALGLRSVVVPLDYCDSSEQQLPTADDVVQSLLAMTSQTYDEWNRQHEPIRRRLLTMQSKSGCTSGSWPGDEDRAAWLPRQGRLPTTCFAALLLSAAYRQLPLHRANSPVVVRRIEPEFPTARQ